MKSLLHLRQNRDGDLVRWFFIRIGNLLIWCMNLDRKSARFFMIRDLESFGNCRFWILFRKVFREKTDPGESRSHRMGKMFMFRIGGTTVSRCSKWMLLP